MFIPLAKLTDLYDGFQQAVMVAGKSHLLLQADGQVYLVENRCPHMDAPLLHGAIVGSTLRCKAHGIAFSLISGGAEGPLAGSLDCLVFVDLVYEGDRVGVDIPSR